MAIDGGLISNSHYGPGLLLLLVWALVPDPSTVQASPALSEPRRGICVEDGLSQRICLSASPTRIVSLAPSLTEMVFELGAGNLLVGRTARCNEPAEVIRVPEIGAYLNPDLERIISLRPDLVLCPYVGMRPEVMTRLTELGIPVFVDYCKNLDEIASLTRNLGSMLGKKEHAETLLRIFQQRRSAVAARVEHLQKPVILFVVGIRPLVTAGGKSFVGSLIREAGGVNVAESAFIPYPRYSMEEVTRHDPDVIVVVNKECRGSDCFDRWKGNETLTAIKTNRTYQMEANLITRPTLKIIEALERLAAILHPEM
ncbi:MAG: helical backbone metal receptor [Pseudomonadota bacterium]